MQCVVVIDRARAREMFACCIDRLPRPIWGTGQIDVDLEIYPKKTLLGRPDGSRGDAALESMGFKSSTFRKSPAWIT
jgi:hypothetical protein